MDYIIEFYKNLDTVNLIIFWGIIIVIILLLIFSIILAIKNKKLERIIEYNGFNNDDIIYNDLAIKEDHKTDDDKQENSIVKESSEQEKNIDNKETEDSSIFIKYQNEIQVPIANAKYEDNKNKFVAEEYVMDYSEKDEVKPNNSIKLDATNKEEKPISNAPYQRNVLKDMSLNQTSPIGIVKKDISNEKDITKARELNEVLNNQYEESISLNDQIKISNHKDNYIKDTRESNNYLKEVSNKLAKAEDYEKNYRTDYEIQQENDAIISYQELMAKKDEIQTIDEEDAVISIGELIERTKTQDKIYNITKEEKTDNFIKELKDFRDDL